MAQRVVGDVAVRLGADVGPLKIGLQDAGRRVDRFEGKTRRMGRSLSSAAKIGAAAIVGMAASIAAAANKAITSMDRIGKKADQIGLAVEAFQELAFAAKSAGVSNEAFTSSMERFSKRLGEAKDGMGAARKELEMLGLNVEELVGLGVEDAFAVIADEIAKMGSATDRSATAAALFGREGVAMVNMLRDGSAALAKTREEARAMGAVIETETIRKAEALEDSMGRLKDVIGAQLSEALIDVGPLLVGLATVLAKIAEATNLVTQHFADMAAGAVEAGKTIADAFRGLEKNLDLDEAINDLLGGGKGGENATDPNRPLTELLGNAPRGTGLSMTLSTGGQPPQVSPIGRPPVLRGDRGASAGGGGGRSGGPLAPWIPTEEDIQQLTEGWQTAREALIAQYDEQLKMVDDFFATQEGRAEEHAEIRAEIERRMQADLAALRSAGAQEALGATSDLFQSMAQISASGGDKLLKIARAFSAAQALISTYEGAAKELRKGVFGFASAAAVIAKGFAFIAAIKGASPGGTGGSGAGGAAVSSAGESAATIEAQAAAVERNINVNIPGLSLRQQSGLRDFLSDLDDAFGDGASINVRGG